MLFLRPLSRSISTSTPIKKATSGALGGYHVKEKIISAEKGLVVLAVGTLAIMLPSPTTLEGVTDVDCFCFEEPFDSH